MKTLLLIPFMFVCACATVRPIADCKQMCTGQKVEYFKDETCECKCAPIERSLASEPVRSN